MPEEWPYSAFVREVDQSSSRFIEACNLLQEALAWIRLEDDQDLRDRIQKFLGIE